MNIISPTADYFIIPVFFGVFFALMWWSHRDNGAAE